MNPLKPYFIKYLFVKTFLFFLITILSPHDGFSQDSTAYKSAAVKQLKSYSSDGESDNFVYLRWQDVDGSDCLFPSITLTITKLPFQDPSGDPIPVRTINSPAASHMGTSYPDEVGPSQDFYYLYRSDFSGWFGCWGWSRTSDRGSTARIRPPQNVNASDNEYDDTIKVTWDESLTDVPTDQYSYRVYRDGNYKATISSTGQLVYYDTDVVPGEEYVYVVETRYYKDGLGSEWALATDTGVAHSLGVYTEATASQVTVRWKWDDNMPGVDGFDVFRRAGSENEVDLETAPGGQRRSKTDNPPIPGFNYMYIVEPYRTSGNWEFSKDSARGKIPPNGSIEGSVKTEAGGNVIDVLVCAERSDEDVIPQGEEDTLYCDTTDASGYYLIDSIYYYDGATFEISPYKENHVFDYDMKTRDLTLGTHSIGPVDFIDKSSFTVKGRVYQAFAGDTCGVDSVEILVNNVSWSWMSNSDGNYNLTVDYIDEYSFAPKYFDHGFRPAGDTMEIADNLENLDFEDTTLYEVSGSIEGPCNIIIGSAKFRIYGKSGECFDTTIATDQLGRFSIMMPGREYYIKLDSFFTHDVNIVENEAILTYFAAVREFDLREGDVSLDFIYRRPPEIRVSGWEEIVCYLEDSVPLLKQHNSYPIDIEILENFGGNTCPADTGYLIITYEFGEHDTRIDTLHFKDGFAQYDIVAGKSNRVSPYLKLIEIVAYVGNTTDHWSRQILVTGNYPRSSSFTTVSPEVPFMILRDPPGDGSYSYLTKETTANLSMKLWAKMSASLNQWGNIKLGTKVLLGEWVASEVKAWCEVKSSFEIGASALSSTELGLSITNTEEFKTSGNQDVTGEEGDVFAGVAINLRYALTDVFTYDPSSCSIIKTVELIMAPEGYETSFIYTEKHIKNVLLPKLAMIRDLYRDSSPDSAFIYQNQINTWQQVLDMNTDLKNRAKFIENFSFSSETSKEVSHEITSTLTTSLEFEMYIEHEVAFEAGFEAAGVGTSGGQVFKCRMDLGGSVTSGVSFKKKTGFILQDDDAGDNFWIGIYKDKVYGTHVFKTVSGESSCPWELGTLPREGVQLGADAYNKFIDNPDDPAIFTLRLGNTSESDESRTYDLEFKDESNPDGASITLGGSPYITPKEYEVPPGQSLAAIVTVSRGHAAYDYNNLRFVLRSKCDGSIQDDALLNVHFESPCSDIGLAKPMNGWSVNSGSGNSLTLRLFNYDKANLTGAGLQYSVGGANAWMTMSYYENAQLDDTKMDYTWSLDNIPDGKYDLRAMVVCESSIGYSDVYSGLVDRKPPSVFGKPSPVDSRMDENDLISVTFDEEVNCFDVSTDNVLLTNLVTGENLPIQVGCSGNKIIILPETTGLNFENDTFRVDIIGIGDINGNVRSDTISWIFDVPGPESFQVPYDGDTDFDGVSNNKDNCPLASNPAQEDLDGDNLGDLCDPDIDGDNVLNSVDNCAYAANPGQEDSNDNGLGDACEQATGTTNYNTPGGFELVSNYPNPFSDYTNIRYRVPVKCQVTITVYNMLGKKISIIQDENVLPGEHEAKWYSRNQADGIYFYSMRVANGNGKVVFIDYRKMILSR